MKQRKIFFAAVAAWFAGVMLASAQTPLSNLVFAVGTTITNFAGQNYSYVLIGSEQPSLLAGKQFAVFGKNGFPTNSGAFTQRGTMAQQTSAAGINALLSQAAVLRDDLTSLSNAMKMVLRKIPGATNQPFAQQLLTAFQLAAADPNMAGTLVLLSRNHPALLLCSGQAFSEAINAVTTYELREINPANGNPGDVIGRVTVAPNTPVVLPAPGLPFQVAVAGLPFRDGPTNTAERIKIYLRWGTPPELRRLGLLNYGFNVWRMTNSVALQNHFDVTPPTLNQLYANATAANDAPVMATKDFDAANPGDSSDTTTFFFADDNGRKFGMPAFADGATYFYFITARDILGRDGFVSVGAPAMACRRLTPDAPTGLKVKNILQSVVVGGVSTNQPRLKLSWTQNTDTNENVTEYWIYEWDNPAAALTNDATPLYHRVGVAPQIAGTNLNQFTDSGANLPVSPSVSNYWFTVRAVSQAACGPLVSPNSAPAWGVLREREGPAAATGQVLGSCGEPVVMFQNYNTLNNPQATNNSIYRFRLTCQRRDSSVAWAMFTFGSPTNQIGPIQFPPDGNMVSIDIPEPQDFSVSATVTNLVTCMVGDYNDNNSAPATNYFITSAYSTNLEQEAVYYAGEILLTALSSSDPLLAALNGASANCSVASSTKPYPDGTVALTFSGLPAKMPTLIQVFLNQSNNWSDVGVAWPDTNNIYWISYPACLIGPVPLFRGCSVNVANNGNCGNHITSAGPGSPIAPIVVSFQLTPRTQEYRLYRSADSGPMTLLSQGAAAYDAANPTRNIVIPDDTMPPTAAHLCYYVQLLDEHGNGGPLAPLGCTYAKPPKPPRPVLAEPIAVGTPANPQVQLNWFCPMSGVHRFQILIQRNDQFGIQLPSGFVQTNIAQILLLFQYNALRVFAGLMPIPLQLVAFSEAQVTPPIGPNFGPGPQFTLTANVVSNGNYTFSVAAMDEMDKAGDAAQVQNFIWKQITTNVQTVPWPARPLPPVTHFDDDNGSTNYRVAATILRYYSYNKGGWLLDTRYPVGIQIGRYRYFYSGINIGGTNFFNVGSGLDPQSLIFQRNSANPTSNGQLLLPVVVYRQQVANAAFPKVSGSLLQVTPLIERIPYELIQTTYQGTEAVVPDLLIGGGLDYYDSHYVDIYLRDQQPVMIGASYHYYVVRFNTKHEPSETIDAGTVTIPPN